MLSQEIPFILQSKWTGIKFIYLISRYLPFVDIIIHFRCKNPQIFQVLRPSSDVHFFLQPKLLSTWLKHNALLCTIPMRVSDNCCQSWEPNCKKKVDRHQNRVVLYWNWAERRRVPRQLLWNSTWRHRLQLFWHIDSGSCGTRTCGWNMSWLFTVA